MTELKLMLNVVNSYRMTENFLCNVAKCIKLSLQFDICILIKYLLQQ